MEYTLVVIKEQYLYIKKKCQQVLLLCESQLFNGNETSAKALVT